MKIEIENKYLWIKNRNRKIISLIMLIPFVLTTMLSISVNATVNSPQFDIQVSATPNSGKVGDTITVNGTITPQPFVTEIPAKEIVLVLDVSGSMDDNVNIPCDNYGERYYCDNCKKILDTTADAHRSEQPYIKHTVFWNGYAYVCSDCRQYVNESHRSEKPYYYHSIENVRYCAEHDAYNSHYSTKIYELKKATKNFIDKMKDVPNLKIGIVTYATKADINREWIDSKNTALIPSNHVNELNEIVDGLNADGGTNTGEGLRKATYLLSNSTEKSSTASKTIVIMSDGLPSFHSLKNDNNNYYNNYYYYDFNTGNKVGYGQDLRYGQAGNPPNDYNNKYYVDITKENDTHLVTNSGDGTNDTSDFKDLGYAKAIGEIIKNQGYNAFTIGYGMNDDGNAKMRQIHNSMTGKDMNDTSITDQEKGFFPTSEGAIDGVLNKIADEILDTYPVTNIDFNLNQPEFDLDIGGNVIHVDNIIYRKEPGSGATITYKADPVRFSFVIKAKNTGRYNLFENSTITFTFNGQIITKKITPVSIAINENTETKVTMKVSDSSGTINKEYDSTVNALNHVVDNNGEIYKLYGQSNVAINFQGMDITHLRYKFIKERQDSDEVQWKYISANTDVNMSKQGFLTQMPYDVSNMELMSNNARWSNRNEVFKTAFTDKTGLISMDVTKASDPYVTSEQVTNKDGQNITRWVPKTLFVEDQWVEGYAPGYREASKTWGYIKVPQTGDYNFRTYSDDGFYGVITVNGEAKVFGDDFEPRGGQIPDKDSIHLEEGKYYPIYIEYFNWGGRAQCQIQYSINNKNNYKPLDKNLFYPSNSDSPIENGNNIFMGKDIVNFVTEPGKYTVEYELVKQTGSDYEVKTAGSFGKFEVEERFRLNKSLSDDKIINGGPPISMTYTLKPNPIKLTDLYKVNSEEIKNITKPNTLSIENIQLVDQLPSGLIDVSTSLPSIVKSLQQIQYNLDNNKGEYIPDKNEYTFTIGIKSVGDNVRFVEATGEIGYRDVSLRNDYRISQKQKFTDIPQLNMYENSEIIRHGLFNGTTVQERAEVNVVDNMNYTFGVVLNARGINNSFTIHIPNTVGINDDIYIYELDSSGNIILNTKQSITAPEKIVTGDNQGNTIITVTSKDSTSKIKTGKQYIVVYSINNVTKDSIITAKLEAGNKKDLNLKLKDQGKLPDLF